MRKKTIAIVLVFLVAFAAGGYLYVSLGRSSATVYNTSFSDVQLDTVPFTSADCQQSVCSTSIAVMIPFAANPGTSLESYYANLIMLSNPDNTTRVVTLISAINVNGDLSDVSKVDVYYFASQSDFNIDGTPAGTPPGACTITTALGCRLFSGTETIQPLGGQYIEVVAYTKGGASQGAVGFSLFVYWR